MANLKAIITKNVGTTLTAAYTNTSGADAALKAFNVNQIGNPTEIISLTPSGSSTGFLGNAIAFNAGTQGEALPFVIQLSENKLLLLTNLYGVTSTTFGRVEAQVVEWDGSKYINYPTTELAFSINTFNASNSARGIGLYGVALTSSKVAVVTNGGLHVLTITNNTVDSVIQTLYVIGIFSSLGIKIQSVPNNTNKVVLYGMNAGVTGYVAQAYNVPTGSAPTTAGSTYTALTTSTFTSFDFCLHRRTDATYFFAAFTASTTVDGAIAVYNPTTDVWTTSAASSTIASGSVSSTNPLVTIPLSTDGLSSYYTGVVIGNSSANFELYAQTSGTTISATSTATGAGTSQAANNNRPLYYYNLGSRKAIIVGSNYISGISDAGTFTSLYGGGAVRDENNPILSLPFNSRPLYFYNNNSGYPNLMARTGLTDTGFGTYTEVGNFIQYGTPNGKAYVWSDTANCWFAVQGETLYALDLNGNVLAEKKLNIFLASNTKQTIKVIAIAPNGRLGFLSDVYGSASQTDCYVSNNLNTSTPFCTFTISSTAITSPTQITSMTVTKTTFNTAGQQPRKAGDLILANNANGVLHFVCCGLGWTTSTQMFWYSANVAAPNTNVSLTSSSLAGTTSPGAFYTNANLLVTSPNTSLAAANIIYIGSQMTSVSTKTGYLSYTTTPVPIDSIGPISTITQLSNVDDDRYVPALSKTQTGMSAVLAPSGSANSLYLWTTSNNTSVASVYTIPSMTGALKPEVLTAQNLTLICNGASGGTAITPFFQYWGITSTTPYASGNATSTSNSILNLSKTPDKFTLSVNGVGTNATYAAYGNNATTFTMTLNDGTNDFYITPDTGSAIAIDTQYRSTDVYYVPVGYSIKTQAGIPRQLDVMLEILEQ